MTRIALTAFRAVRGVDRVVMAILAIILSIALVSSEQAVKSIAFTGGALVDVSFFLLLSVGVTAYAKASGSDRLIARAFSGRTGVMIAAASLMGALSPFCSCGVIPLIAALLAMGVPLPAVMAFWLASPLMDPSMFVLTAGTLGLPFAIYKTVAAVAMGLIGGFGTAAVMRRGGFTTPLRPGVGDGGCAGAAIRGNAPPVWRFWTEHKRRETFRRSGLDTIGFLGKWLALAFLLESLMLTYVPAELIASTLGGGWLSVLTATVVGVPAYLNGYAALPLVGGLIEQGMAPGAGMAFLLAGGVTSVPAAIAVYALARPPVFAAYLTFAMVGSLGLGVLFGLAA